jgi:hypothetical protein
VLSQSQHTQSAPHQTHIDISLPVCAKEGSEELGTDPVVVALAQQMAREAVQHPEGLRVLIANAQGDLLDLLFDQNQLLHR